MLSFNAISIEKLVQEGKLDRVLGAKRIGVYVGSFDPCHVGHDALLTEVLRQKLCDLVLIYPAWSSDSFKQGRTDVNVRLDMLHDLYSDNNQVLVTRYEPVKLQQILPDILSNGKYRNGVKFTAIMGSDNALASYDDETLSDEERMRRKYWMSKIYMRGITLKEDENTSLGSLKMIYAENFIIGARNADYEKIKHWTKLDDRYCVVIQNDYEDVSSGQIKDKLAKGDTIANLVPAKILEKVQGIYSSKL